jgi:hypothetical protein
MTKANPEASPVNSPEVANDSGNVRRMAPFCESLVVDRRCIEGLSLTGSHCHTML